MLDFLYFNFSVSYLLILCGEGHTELRTTLVFHAGSRDQTQVTKLEASAFSHQDNFPYCRKFNTS